MAAFAFKRDDSVLLFNLRDHVGGAPYQQRRYVLWPVWVYRVIAPSSENQRLNILQKAVLGLCNAGIFEVRRVADSLDIHPNLAKEIILELQQEGLVNSGGLPTDKGRETLQDEIINSSKSMTVGHIFQDPTTGELWPIAVRLRDLYIFQSITIDNSSSSDVSQPFFPSNRWLLLLS
jgi:hypothetical protein